MADADRPERIVYRNGDVMVEFREEYVYVSQVEDRHGNQPSVAMPAAVAQWLARTIEREVP